MNRLEKNATKSLSGAVTSNEIHAVTMMKQFLIFFALFASASAFAPVSQTAFGVAKSSSALNMAMKTPDFAKPIAAAAAGFMPVLLSSTAAVATEGTGEWFGVDDTRLLAVLFLGHFAILYLWYQQYGDYDESEDFFGEIDYTRAPK